MSVTTSTPAGRFGASKPPVFGGSRAATSTPSGNPFAWRGNGSAAAPLSSSSNPFAQPTRTANAGVTGGAFGALGGSTGSFGATSFGPRQLTTASPFGAPTARFGHSSSGFTPCAKAGLGGNATPAAASSDQASTGWFPLTDASSPPKPRAFGASFADQSRPVTLNASTNPFLGSLGSRNVVGSSNPSSTFHTAPSTGSVFAPKTASTNPFAVGNVGTGSAQTSTFSTHWFGRKPSPTNPTASTIGNGFVPLSAHSDIAGVTPQPSASGWQFSMAPSSRSIASTGMQSRNKPGFRFTGTPSWPLSGGIQPALPQQSKVFSSCFAFPKTASPWVRATQDETSRFTFKCDSDWNPMPTLAAGSAPTGFGVKLATAVPAIEQKPKSLVALLDVNPYGAGSFGSGSLEVVVKAALSFEHAPSERSSFFPSPQPKPKPKPKPPVIHANLGLPTRPINCYQLKTTRRLIGDRNSLRVASIRRAVVARRAWAGVPLSSGEQRVPAAHREFTFKSSLFQELGSKKNVAAVSESKGDAEEQQEDETVQFKATPTCSKVDKQPPGNPACPILSNAEISTMPELCQLQRMSSEDLAHVDGFAIRSAKFGEIEWPGVTDVRHLNLDDILLFSESEVVVYPDENPNKPEVGQGLNKRAILRLSHIYPSETNRTAGDEGAEAAAFVERLKKRTTDLRARFLSYEVAGGVWEFEVQHF